MLAISIPAFLLTDKWGRRSSAIFGGVGLAGLMFLIGSLYAAGAVTVGGSARWVVVVSVFLHGMLYCATWGIVAKVYASEIQPGNTRAAANSVAMALSYFTNWFVAFITPILLSASAFGAYFLFGGVTLITVGILATYMPETRGRSLEDIQQSFQRPAVPSIIRSVLGRFAKTAPSTQTGGILSEEMDNGNGVELHALEQQRSRDSRGVAGSVAQDGLPRPMIVSLVA